MDTFIEGVQSHYEDYDDGYISYSELKQYIHTFLDNEQCYLEHLIDSIDQRFADEAIIFVYNEFPTSFNLLCHKIVMRLVMNLAQLNTSESLKDFTHGYEALQSNFFRLNQKMKSLDVPNVLESKYNRYTKAFLESNLCLKNLLKSSILEGNYDDVEAVLKSIDIYSQKTNLIEYIKKYSKVDICFEYPNLSEFVINNNVYPDFLRILFILLVIKKKHNQGKYLNDSTITYLKTKFQDDANLFIKNTLIYLVNNIFVKDTSHVRDLFIRLGDKNVQNIISVQKLIKECSNKIYFEDYNTKLVSLSYYKYWNFHSNQDAIEFPAKEHIKSMYALQNKKILFNEHYVYGTIDFNGCELFCSLPIINILYKFNDADVIGYDKTCPLQQKLLKHDILVKCSNEIMIKVNDSFKNKNENKKRIVLTSFDTINKNDTQKKPEQSKMFNDYYVDCQIIKQLKKHGTLDFNTLISKINYNDKFIESRIVKLESQDYLLWNKDSDLITYNP